MKESDSAHSPVEAPRDADGASPRAKIRPSWFGALARLWTLRAVDGAPRAGPILSIVLLSAWLLGMWIVIDWWQRQPDPEFSVEGVPLLGWYILALLTLAALLRWGSTPRPALGATLVLALGAAPLPLFLVSVVPYYLESPWYPWACCAVAFHGCVFLLRGLRMVTGRPQRRGTLIGVLFVVAFAWVSDAIDAIPDVWNPRDPISADSKDEITERETALFEQADRIDEALEAVHRNASASSQAFFLGFAGVGEQKVFAQEIELAARVLGRRFEIGSRQVSLINDERDLQRAPLASVSGLRYALQGLASRMDVDKDVLFLSISSHGSAEPIIAVSNSQFPLNNLTRGALVDALQASGIKWRVIIVSACYAGGFIESLRDPKTILITAAAADRTSFGCSNDSDLTYFGEAFYRDALPGSRSLRDAFEKAAAAIAARERREHETASNPQAYFGAEIEPKLNAIYR